jgi:hypothetical protein
MSSKGSVWFASCLPPITDSKRTNRSHFAAGQAILGVFEFNTVHLDGHVGGGRFSVFAHLESSSVFLCPHAAAFSGLSPLMITLRPMA